MQDSAEERIRTYLVICGLLVGGILIYAGLRIGQDVREGNQQIEIIRANKAEALRQQNHRFTPTSTAMSFDE